MLHHFIKDVVVWFSHILIEGEELEHCRVMGVPKLLIREM
jgi:hypothetical protein